LTLSGFDLRLVDLDILRLNASQNETEPHVAWHVSYAPEIEEELGRPGRVVFGTIHAHSETGGADVTGACIMLYEDASAGTEDFFEALKASDALETLWDFVRSTTRGLLGIVGSDAEIPVKAPEAKFSLLSRPGAADDKEDTRESD
jgi:hypothetical protein